MKPHVLNCYLRPRVGNLGAVDSLALISSQNIAWRIRPPTYEPSLPTLVLFQATISHRHPISLAGIHDVLNAIPINARKDAVGKETPNLHQVVTAFSMERLWGFRDWQSDGDMFVDVDNQGEHGYIGDQVRQSQRHVSDVIKRLFATP